MKTLKLLILLLIFPIEMAFSQRERNYIYLFDCTQSMIYQVNIWSQTKQYLKDDIMKLSPTSTVSIVPFQNNSFPVVSFVRSHFKWEDVEKKLDEYIKSKSGTNICAAWDMGLKYLDKNKDNYFMLLTDGNDTFSGMTNVCKRINDWCGKYKNSYAFYVMLTPSARNPELTSAINSCQTSVFMIDANGHPKPFGAFTPNTINLSTLDLRPRILSFSASGEYSAKAVTNDPLFNVQLLGNIKDGKVTIKASPKGSLQTLFQQLVGKDSYTFTASILTDTNKIKIINPTLSITVSNKPERVLNILSDEPDLGKAKYYKSFLFWKERKQDTLSVDLKAVFNAEACKVHSSVVLKCASSDGKQGFTILYNGKAIKDSLITFNAGATPSILSVIFDKDSKTGKRYFTLTPVEGSINQLERINDNPAIDYVLTLRAHYDVDMNPLLIISMWIGIILVAFLLVWFIMVRPYFDKFKCHSISLTIGDKIYSPRLYGKHLIKITNDKKESQSFFNRLFMGEKVIIINEYVDGIITIEPKKRSGKICYDRKCFDLNPTDRELLIGTEYQLINSNSNTNIISFKLN